MKFVKRMKYIFILNKKDYRTYYNNPTEKLKSKEKYEEAI